MKKWTEERVAYAVARCIFPWRRYVVVPNVYWGLLPHEADLAVLSDAGWLSEVEIKIRVSDFRNDAKKAKHKSPGLSVRGDCITDFYYAMPADIWAKSNPEWLLLGAGLITVEANHTFPEHDMAKVVQKPMARPTARKLSEAERLQLIRLGYLRYWSRRETAENMIAAAYEGAAVIARSAAMP